MLSTSKNINLIGESKIEGVTAVYLTANVSTDGIGTPSINQNFINEILYKNNRTECRKDISKFTDLVYEVQDEIFGLNTSKDSNSTDSKNEEQEKGEDINANEAK